MPPVGFEPAVPASGLSQIHALDRTATAIGPRPFISWVTDVTLLHVTVSQCCALTVHVHISTPASVYLVCLAKLSAAALLDAMWLTHKPHTRASCAPSDWLLYRTPSYVLQASRRQHIDDHRSSFMTSFGQQHAVTLWRTALCVSA